MYWKTTIVAVLLGSVIAGCSASSDRQWMKINEQYSTADFRRDHAACTRGGTLDDACMRSRGWVDVNPSKAEKPADPDATRHGVYTPANQRGGR
jgi:hypothetical protein